MLRPTAALLALLAATPAAALSVSSAACNGQSAQLVTDAAGTRFTVNGDEVALEEGIILRDLSCVSRDDDTLFGLTGLSADSEEAYFLLNPETLVLAPVSYEDAEALGFWDTEDDWFDD